MHARHVVPLSLSAVILLTAAECGDTATDVPVESTLEIVSGSAQEGVVGETLTSPLVVQVLDQDDAPMADVVVTWSTGSGAIASDGPSNASGQASAAWTLGTTAGAVTATASVESGVEVTFSATAQAGSLDALTLSSDSLVFGALGDDATVTATGADAHGNVVSGIDPTWISRDTAVATVSAAGLVTAQGNGATWVVADASTIKDSARVRVAQVAATVVVTPDTATLTVGDTMTFSAAAEDANGHVLAAPSFTWSSSVPAAAAVDSTGLVTAQARGTAWILATAGEASDSARVTVESGTGTVVNPVCPAGNDPALVGDWAATEFWNESTDAIAEGNSIQVSLYGDSTGRIIEVWPYDAPVDTTMVTDSAHIAWTGCSGQLTLEFPEQFIQSANGSYESTEATYAVTSDTLHLVIDSLDYGTFTRVSTGTLDPDLYGDWIVIRDLYRSDSNPADTVDLVPLGEVLVQLKVSDTGTLLYSELEPDLSRYDDVGIWSVSGDTIVHYSARDNEVVRMPYTKPAADRFTFQRHDAEAWDFDNDGTEDPADEIGTAAHPDTTGMVGTWVATAYTMTNKADTTQVVDMIAEGSTVTVTYDGQGDYTVNMYTPGDGTSVMTGTYTAAGGYVWMIEPGEGVTFLQMAIDGDTATVQGSNYHDFDKDGMDEEALMKLTMARQP